MRLAFLCTFFIGTFCTLQAQIDCRFSNQITDVINTYHLSPQNIDDSLSSRIFSELFYQLDPGKEFFSKEDINQLAHLRLLIDDQLNSKTCDFLTAFEKLYLKKIERTRAFIDSALQKPLLYAQHEFYNSVEANTKFNTERIRKAELLIGLKHDILVASYLKTKKPETAFDRSAFNKAEAELRLRIKSKELSGLEKLIRDQKSESMNQLLAKTIAATYDPHTEYFSREEIREFEAAISTQELSFGFDIEQNHLGEIKIRRLMPGGPAWNTNELHAGDVLLEIKSNEIYDVLDMDYEEAVSLLRDPPLNKAEIKIRKSNGEIKTVSLVKAKIENTENIISSFLLKGEKRIGYISLPGFFTDTETQTINGCANVVAKEILKLKSENIEGLILDLRFNGGGSMLEAIELAGIFIDAGPLAITQEKAQLVVLKDMNRGIAYTGPLAIMINNGSASASELVAAAMQDYNRALIIGSASFGKATGQIVMPIDKANEESGFAKITMERIFRINGNSIQQKGVTPDIELPDLGGLMKMNESTLRYSLPSSSITKKVYFTPHAGYPVADLKELSKRRVEVSQDFQSIGQLSQLFSLPIPIERNAFIQFNESLEKTLSALKETKNTSFEVLNTKLNESLFKVDQYHQDINQQARETVQKSFYIKEAYQIMSDFMNNRKP